LPIKVYAKMCIQGRPKSDTLFVFEFPLWLDALYLQFLFIRGSFSSNGVALRLPQLPNSGESWRKGHQAGFSLEWPN